MPEYDSIIPEDGEPGEPVLLSALNHFLYCDRRCALIHVEGVYNENAFTVEGQLGHQTADGPDFETRQGVRVVRVRLRTPQRCIMSPPH